MTSAPGPMTELGNLLKVTGLVGTSMPLYALVFGLGSTVITLLMLLVQSLNPELLDRGRNGGHLRNRF